MDKKAKTKIAIFSFLLIAILSASTFAIFGVAGERDIQAHNNKATIEPEWSQAGIPVDYTVTICNVLDGNDSIDEVRLYETTGYNITIADEKDGWYKSPYHPIKKYYQYTAEDSSNYLTAGKCTDFTFTAITPSETPACNLEWVFETRDINDVWKFAYARTSVDKMSPSITKEIVGPQVGPCPPGKGEECWVQDHNTNIIVSVEDQGFCNPPSGIDYCRYSIILDGSLLFEHTFNPDEPEQRISWLVNFTEDSVHDLNIKCVDVAGNVVEDSERFRVDSTPPITKKTYGLPFYTNGVSDWITLQTLITLTAEDPDPTGESCNIGLDKTWYLDMLMSESDEACCYFPEKCGPMECVMPSPEISIESIGCEWQEYTIPFKKNEESCHLIQYYSIDNLGNVEPIKWQYVFVDDTPPVLRKVVGEPKVQIGDTDDYYVTQQTPITLTCIDGEPHPSGAKTIYWRYKVNEGNGFGPWIEFNEDADEVTFNFTENSMHEFEAWCVDNVGLESQHDNETFYVDSDSPVITKTMFGSWLGDCPPKDENDVCYVADNGQSGVIVNVTDVESIHSVDEVSCNYDVWWFTSEENCGDRTYSTDKCLVDNGIITDKKEKTIIFGEDSTHKLYIHCEDALGNFVEDTETFLVDSTPPVTTKTYEGPQYPAEMTYPKWINFETLINLTVTDNKVGVDKTYWKTYLVNDEACYDVEKNCYPREEITSIFNGYPFNEFNEYTGPFNIEEQSCHLIEYYSVDLLGNTEQIKWQCVFVEDTAPVLTKTVGTPNVPIAGTTKDYYITQQTPITLSCSDNGDHPVDQSKLYYRMYLKTEEAPAYAINDKGYVVVNFAEDSEHFLEAYCEDALGNRGAVDKETFIVDTQAPEIVKEMKGPYFGTCPPNPILAEVMGTSVTPNGNCYVDTATSIVLSANDPEPHPVDNTQCRWRYSVQTSIPQVTVAQEPSAWSDWSSSSTITFPEESYHYLQVECKDALGNLIGDTEMFIVDKSVPIITKTYTGSYFAEETQNGLVEWINSQTLIHASAVDPEPHPSGLKSIEYRTTLLGNDDACNNVELCQRQNGGTASWKPYTEAGFNIAEQSCHLIEIKATDNVGKNSIHKQCVFVDNTAPTPVKEVGEPRTPWNGLDANFYNLSQFCLTPGNCWKVTTLTPISLSCEDLEPHPVDHENVCFKVEVDADDYTQKYCNNAQGTISDENEYCCMQGEPEFHFTEVSEHNLKYYCVDALGNKGAIDDEKFKVEEDAFEIQINKKWNLISVPVRLLDDSMDLVFDNPNSKVKSVWQYDAVNDEWHIYSPDGNPGNDDITTMEPGFGYWVLANESDMIVIGGSLMSPAMTPPSVPIVHGWNLVGYYGLDGAPEGVNGFPGYYGPAGNGSPGDCAFNTLGASLLDKEFTSLWGYWEPSNPNSWSQYDKYDNLDPGAGYWLFVQEEGIYAPSTTCNVIL